MKSKQPDSPLGELKRSDPRKAKAKAAFKNAMTGILARALALGSPSVPVIAPKGMADVFRARHLAAQMIEASKGTKQ